jgi:DNA-binding response OmpR family regulator
VTRPGATRRLEVLTINNHKKDCASLRSIMAHTNWAFHCVPDLCTAIQFLEMNRIPVVVCPAELTNSTWKDVLAAVRRYPNPPEVLVHTARADDKLWMEVLNSGGYDLLPVPFNRNDVLRVISLAARKWHDDANGSKQPATLKAAG